MSSSRLWLGDGNYASGAGSLPSRYSSQRKRRSAGLRVAPIVRIQVADSRSRRMITLLGGGSSMAPFFFFSYVHDDNDEFLEKFFNDLRDEVAAVTTLDKADVAFRDLSGIGLMQPWRQEIVNALSTCECFVPLLTPRLIVHPYCGQEWEIFRRRLQVNPLPASGAPSRLMPILWRPLRGPLPPVISDHQRTHGTFGRPYAEDGLFMLLKQKEYDSEYARFLKRFVEMMIEAVQAAPLPASASPGDLESMPNAFQSANGRPAAAGTRSAWIRDRQDWRKPGGEQPAPPLSSSLQTA